MPNLTEDRISLLLMFKQNRIDGDQLQSLLTEILALRQQVEKARAERDNLEMAYRHSKQCFYGAVRASNPDGCAERDVELAKAGNGPRARALKSGEGGS